MLTSVSDPATPLKDAPEARRSRGLRSLTGAAASDKGLVSAQWRIPRQAAQPSTETGQPHIIITLEPWLRDKLALVSQKSKLAEAIRYALTRWNGLTLFLDDGRVELDTNVVERAIRPIALNRKNSLFAGSDGGARHWAVIASLIETCKLNGVEPRGYLADVITRIVEGHKNRSLDELLPWNYIAAPALKDVA